MQNYLKHRKLVTCICDCCGAEFQKPASEYNRNLKMGRKNFCSRTCSAIIANKSRAGKPASPAIVEHLKKINPSHQDELSPFRYIFRSVRSRSKE